MIHCQDKHIYPVEMLKFTIWEFAFMNFMNEKVSHNKVWCKTLTTTNFFLFSSHIHPLTQGKNKI